MCSQRRDPYWAPKGHLTSPLGFYYDFSFKFPFAHYGRKLFYRLDRRSRTLLLLLIQTCFVLDLNKLFFSFHCHDNQGHEDALALLGC